MPASNNRGFTLIEVLITSVIFSMVITTAYFFWQFFNENYQFTLEQSQNLDESYNALTRIVRELREIETAQGGSFELELTHDQELIFYADVDQDNISERIRYWLDTTNLKRGITEPSGDPIIYDSNNESVSIIAKNIANNLDPIFYYYNNEWPQDTINNPLAIGERLLSTKLITVTISVKADIENLRQDPVMLSQSVSLRRLKNN